MSRRNLWYDCMFINMRFVVLILPVLVCDVILTVGIFTINKNCRFFLCYDESGSRVLVWFAGHSQGCVAVGG